MGLKEFMVFLRRPGSDVDPEKGDPGNDRAERLPIRKGADTGKEMQDQAKGQ
jgi:hypothetical protein